MALVDLDCDGRITESEFSEFRTRLSLLMQLPKADKATWETLSLVLPEGQTSAQVRVCVHACDTYVTLLCSPCATNVTLHRVGDAQSGPARGTDVRSGACVCACV
jgi:hypothetical protein